MRDCSRPEAEVRLIERCGSNPEREGHSWRMAEPARSICSLAGCRSGSADKSWRRGQRAINSIAQVEGSGAEIAGETKEMSNSPSPRRTPLLATISAKAVFREPPPPAPPAPPRGAAARGGGGRHGYRGRRCRPHSSGRLRLPPPKPSPPPPPFPSAPPTPKGLPPASEPLLEINPRSAAPF